MVRVLVSACLLGEKVRYHGGDARHSSSILARWIEEGRVVPFCPEVAGGLSVPRPPAEIQGDGGGAVIDFGARVTTRAGDDVTGEFLEGAQRAVETATDLGVGVAILVDGSPSCGSREVHDGRFAGQRRPGKGVATVLLERNGVRVFAEDQIAEAAALLRRLEDGL